MSRRSINYKRNRKKSKCSSPGGTPGPFGRIQHMRDFINITEEINQLKQTNQLLKTNKREINEPMEMIKVKFSSKLLQSNLNEQSRSNTRSVASFEQQQQQQQQEQQQRQQQQQQRQNDANVAKGDEAADLIKFERLSLDNKKNPSVNLSVKQRVQMSEVVVTRANNEFTMPIKHIPRFINKLDNYSSESLIQKKRRRKGTPMPKYRKTFAKISTPE
ncbi:hypothetical protein ACH3XW_31570 [Acanthocheilonema viteae]